MPAKTKFGTGVSALLPIEGLELAMALVDDARVVRAVIPTQPPRALGSGCGHRSPVRYGRKNAPSLPGGACLARSINNSYGSRFFFFAAATSASAS